MIGVRHDHPVAARGGTVRAAARRTAAGGTLRKSLKAKPLRCVVERSPTPAPVSAGTVITLIFSGVRSQRRAGSRALSTAPWATEPVLSYREMFERANRGRNPLRPVAASATD